MPVTVPANANSTTGQFSGSSGGGSDVGHSPTPAHPSTTSSLQIPVSPSGSHHMASTTPTSPRPTSCNG